MLAFVGQMTRRLDRRDRRDTVVVARDETLAVVYLRADAELGTRSEAALAAGSGRFGI